MLRCILVLYIRIVTGQKEPLAIVSECITAATSALEHCQTEHFANVKQSILLQPITSEALVFI